MPARRRLAVAAVSLVMGMIPLAGCSGPSPTPTVSLPPASPSLTPEEEAFRAAEETYRAYVDALNAVDLSDPATFEPVFALTTGELTIETRQSLESMRSNGWTVSGTSVVLNVQLVDATERTVQLAACVDVGEVTVRDAEGAVVRAPDRAEQQQLRLHLTSPKGRDFVVTAVGEESEVEPCDF